MDERHQEILRQSIVVQQRVQQARSAGHGSPVLDDLELMITGIHILASDLYPELLNGAPQSPAPV